MLKLIKIELNFCKNRPHLTKRLFFWILVSAFGIIGSVQAVLADETAAYDTHQRRDPFVPLVTQSIREASGLAGIESADELKIEGVVCDPKGSVVIVNGTVLKEGEEVGALKIVKIDPGGAHISINGSESYIPLYKEEDKSNK